MSQILGVDISHWQANVDFQKLKDNNVRFAIFKAGEIPTSNKLEFTDDKYERNIREASRVGIITGAYYFFHPAIGGKRQARHFDALMDKFGYPELPPVIDAEVDDNREPAEVAAVMKEMIDELERRGYRKPMIYSRWGFLVNQAGEPFWLKNHLLWLAQYNKQLVNKPADMSNVVIWQFTDKMRLPGVGLDLDGNYWLKTESELLQLVKRRQPAVPSPTVQVEEPQTQPPAEPVQVPEPQPEPEEEMDDVVEEVVEDQDEFIIPTQPAIEPEEESPSRIETPESITIDVSPDRSEQTTSPSQSDSSSGSENTSPSTMGAGVSFWDMLVRLIQAFLDSLHKK